MLGVDLSTRGRVRNSSDLGACLSSMRVNWIGRVAIRALSRRSWGDFQPIDANHEMLDLIPSPCVVFDLGPFSWPEFVS